MNDQDKRAVEGLARSGISLEGLYEAFPKFPMQEVRAIYEQIHKGYETDVDTVTLKMANNEKEVL